MHWKYLFALSLSCSLHSAVMAASLEIPTLSSYLWKGQDLANAQPCFITIRSNNIGLISSLSYEGHFNGWATSLPPSLTVSESGLFGIAHFMRGLTPESVSYESTETLVPGLILRSIPLPGQDQLREAVLSGPSLVTLESLKFRIHEPELSLDATCTQLVRQRVD